MAAQKEPTGCKQSAAKTAALYLFRGFESAGRGETPFLFAQTRDSKKLENIRENTTLRNLESTESKADLESNPTKPNAFTESSPIDSVTSTESKAEILKMCKDRI